MQEEYKGKRYKSSEELGVTHQRAPARITRIEPKEIGGWSPGQDRAAVPSSTAAKLTVSGSHTDKARAFLLVTLPLSFGLGLTAALLGVLMAFFNLISGWFVVVLFGVFSVSLSVMYLIDKLVSPDGYPILSEYWRHRRLMKEQNQLYKILERDTNE